MASTEGRFVDHLLDPKNFNLTSLLTSGNFYLDPTGLLVLPNGSRFRLPSGPPEGRRPLRPHTIDLELNSTAFEQHDSSKTNSVQTWRNVTEHPFSITSLPTTMFVSETTSVYMKPTNLAVSEWNVIFATLIITSISLACNIGLLFLSSWIYRGVSNKRRRDYISKLGIRDCETNSLNSCSHNTRPEPIKRIRNLKYTESRSHHSRSKVDEFKQSRSPSRKPPLKMTHIVETMHHCSNSEDSERRESSADSAGVNYSSGDQLSSGSSRSHSDTVFRPRKKSALQNDISSAPSSLVSESTSSELMKHDSKVDDTKQTQTVAFVMIFHTLVIHIGISGTLLCVMQLAVVCYGLRANIEPSHSGITSTNTFEFICVLSTSLAADTIICARQYLISASLIVFWLSIAYTLGGSWCCKKSRGSENQTFQKQLVKKQNWKYYWAYVALLHSIPWAISAGTALLITYTVYIPRTEVVTNQLQSNLNIFFRGLDKLLICHSVVSSTPPTDSASASDDPLWLHSIGHRDWISSLSLLFLPFLLHILICFLFTIFIRFNICENKNFHPVGENIMCKTIFPVFLLVFIEFLSCAFPFLWSVMKPMDFEISALSVFADRSILIHLLIDPLLIIILFHSLVRKLELTSPVKFRGTPKVLQCERRSPADDRHCRTIPENLPSKQIICNSNNNLYKHSKTQAGSLLLPCIPRSGVVVQHIPVPCSETLLNGSAKTVFCLPPRSMTMSQSSNQSDGMKTLSENVQQAIPQLCQRHQQMLAEHYRSDLPSHVPRIWNTQTCLPDMMDSLDAHSNISSSVAVNNIATAAVMAAAAAAVAAQAGTLKRS